MVPANAEIIIEGEVPLNDQRPEGPYGEMVGYQGPRKERQYWMRVTAVTHRKDPWIMNNFTGLSGGSLIATGHARSFYEIKQQIPGIVDFYADNRTQGVTFASIRKTRPFEGLEAAKHIAETRFNSKIVIVVDDDLDIMNHEQMFGALGARWQPYQTTHLYESLPGLPTDPSSTQRGRNSKVAIDATKQWPEEGGREKFPSWNRTLLEQGAPDAFARVDEQWGEIVRNWRPPA
jgi:4-hydroxy-3-polyprenylbenzoate decarboxylase